MITIKGVNQHHNDDAAMQAMRADEVDMVKVFDFLTSDHSQDELSFLQDTTVEVTSVGRSFTPDFKSYSDVAKALGTTEDMIRSRFFNRESGMISENEWIYKQVIYESSNPITDRAFVKVGGHFWKPNCLYGAAIDLRVKNYTAAQAQTLENVLIQKFSTIPSGQEKGDQWFFVYLHSIKGNGNHIHLEDKRLYRTYSEELSRLVFDKCGYGAPQVAKRDPSIPASPVTKQSTARSTPQDLSTCNYLVQTDQAEELAQSYGRGTKNPSVKEEVDNRISMPSDISEEGLMEVLRIGDVNFSICPVTQVSYSQSMQFVRFSTLRTAGDPKIATDTMPNNITLNIIFPNAAAINNELAALTAQFIATPVTIVQNRFIARTLKSLVMDHKDNTTENPFLSPDDESIWMVMTDLNIRSIPNFPEAYEAYITLEWFEDRVFGSRLKFLKTYNDVVEKYKRKHLILGEQYILPSEKAMLQSASYYNPGVLNVTSDPGSSDIYKDFYKSVQEKLAFYNPEAYDGKLTVIYNTQDLNRESIRRATQKFERAYNQSLIETAKILEDAGVKTEEYLRGQGLGVITSRQIKAIAHSTIKTTTDQLAIAIQEAEVSKTYMHLRYGAVDPILKFAQIKRDADIYIKQVVAENKLEGMEDVLKGIMTQAINGLGTLSAYSDGITSVGMTNEKDVALRDIMKNPPAADQVSSGPLLGAMEVLIGERLFDLTKAQVKDDNFTVQDQQKQTVAKERLDRLLLAISRLTRLTLYNVIEEKDKSERYIDMDSLTKHPNTFKEAVLADGVESITTGVSFSISNKIVPQQVIGWRHPTFQHLGRSDWTINLNIFCKGDDFIRKLMFILNKTGTLSKQLQFTSPAKFVNLDTTLHIKEGDPIFKTLGVNKVVLNTVEISSIPGQPNSFQISLGLEQADLTVRNMESITEGKNKRANELAEGAILKSIVPMLKALIIRADHKRQYKFLNFKTIQNVVEDPRLIPVWQAYGLCSATGESLYDYMDKYNFYKMVRKKATIIDPVKEWDILVKDCFPLPGEESQKVLDTAVGLIPKGFLQGQVFRNILDGMITLEGLVEQEVNGTLMWVDGDITKPERLASTLEPYFEGMRQLVNSSLNAIANKQRTSRGETAAQRPINPLVGAAAGAVVGDLIAVALVSNPIGWAITAAIIVGTVGYLAVKTLNKVDVAVQTMKDAIPNIMPAVFKMAVNNRVVDLAKEIVADQTTLSMFSPDFIIGEEPFAGAGPGKAMTLQTKVRELREIMIAGMTGCYNDFDEQIVAASQKTHLPIYLIDPAFYLYSEDAVTTDLIRELRVDVQNRMSLLVTRANVNAIQLGTELEQKLELEKDSDLTTDLSSKLLPSNLINQDDIKWVIDVKRKIKKLTQDTFENPTKKKIQAGYEMQNNTAQARDVFFSKYWDEKIVEDKTAAFMESAFARLQLVNVALRFDVLKTFLTQTTNAIASKMTNLGNSINREDKTLYDDYDLLFRKVEYKKMTWYDAIIDAGGINQPYTAGESVNMAFSKIDPHQKNMESYFSRSPKIAELLGQIEALAVCKKAAENPVSAQMMAQYNALDADPRMLEKRIDQLQSMQDILFKASITDNTGSPIRIFPTYKIYLIEEDAPEWGIYNDFYDYSAIQEITVVKDRKSASDTCVIKLSNVAGKLTDSFADNIPEIGTKNLPMTSMMLKPGISILVKMGYSNNQVELPVVFYGIIVEVAPGPIVEIICQGYGAELNEQIAPNEGVHHGVFGHVKALGDVATWALQEATGLNHFGKLGATEFGVKDSLRLSGTSLTGLQGKMKMASFLTGLPGLNMNDPRDDNIFLPYNLANVRDKDITGKLDLALTYIVSKFSGSRTNLNFDWYVRDQSIWDVLGELVYFSPDFIKTVLPYNDNVFPFIPKIRNTLYVGPRRGYYKYTDMYSIVAKTTNVEFPQSKRAQELLFDIGRKSETEKNLQATGPISVIHNMLRDYDYSESMTEIKQMFVDDPYFHTALFAFFGTDSTATTSIKMFGIEETSKENKIRELAVAYLKQYSNYNLLITSTQHTKVADVIYDQLIQDKRDLGPSLKKYALQDVGLNGIYYNMWGNHHQFKKVQQHHIATSHTNILNNNIQASATGWANQIKLICPPDPTNAKDKADIAISDRSDLITTVFNLDDDILDDQIVTKEVFVNNIDPSMWDDSIWAKKILKGEGTWTTINTKNALYSSFETQADGSKKPIVKDIKTAVDDNEITLDEKGNSYKREGWETLPSRWRVGISMLAEEARDMYNGELTLIGNAYMKPYDVVHMIDYVNDMHGSFEIGRVIHSMSPQTGFVTRIKPDLIVNQKNRFNADEIFIGSQMAGLSVARMLPQFLLWGGGSVTAGLGITALLQTAALSFPATAGLASIIGTAAFVGLPILVGFIGYKAVKAHHERYIMIMNNIIGRDSLEIIPLTYRNVPYVAGVEGIKKDSYMRHMYGSAIDENGKFNIFERMGYMNAPMEFEFYTTVAKDSPVWAFLQTTANPLGMGEGGGIDISKALFKGITGE